ncbi:cellulase family glycosylhydrolase [Dickeya chrysanthemi]|nr:cellulase family glycosylhydrolase [Dickeya chrysanthemi]WJM85514.1 cellulase family glycosylhydrolase [Dickeya chrysanthemi]
MHGLWARNWKDMIIQIQGLGFNAVRLPFCPATLRATTTPSSIDYGRNPDLQGLTSLQILDKVINEFNARGIYVLLDHHTPDCGAISECVNDFVRRPVTKPPSGAIEDGPPGETLCRVAFFLNRQGADRGNI